MQSVVTKSQKISFTKQFQEYGETHTITATIRYDDQCGNGHNSFGMTGVVAKGIYKDANNAPDSKWQQCGCIHDDIARHFPDLEKYLKWHFMNSDGPTHYAAISLNMPLIEEPSKSLWYTLSGIRNPIPHFLPTVPRYSHLL